MNTVTLNLKLPQDVYLALQSSGLNRDQLEAQASRDMAGQMYAEGRLSLGKAAKMAGLPISTFWLSLVERGLPVFDYTKEDYEDDLAVVKRWVMNAKLAPKTKHSVSKLPERSVSFCWQKKEG